MTLNVLIIIFKKNKDREFLLVQVRAASSQPSSRGNSAPYAARQPGSHVSRCAARCSCGGTNKGGNTKTVSFYCSFVKITFYINKKLELCVHMIYSKLILK